jgi:hypothetical protein
VAAGERVGHAVADTVGVPPPQGREAGVEAVGGRDHTAYPEVVRQDAVEPALERHDRVAVVPSGGADEVRLLDVEVDDLPAGVDSRVGTAGTGHRSRRHTQHGDQCGLQLALHRP